MLGGFLLAFEQLRFLVAISSHPSHQWLESGLENKKKS
jgi:hypothetical protein